jgi:preprotein translocase subunit SecA
MQEQNDYEGLKLSCILHFGIETKIEEIAFQKGGVDQLAEELYEEAKAGYYRKTEQLKKEAIPVFRNIRTTQGGKIENVFVPFSDGNRSLQVLADLQKTIDSGGTELILSLERSITLAFIDDSWKEHLRAMDDLRTSVQNATYEQKDPLVIYKQEAFNLFIQLNYEINKNIVSFLSHAHLPSEHQGQTGIREGRVQKTDMSKTKQRKEETLGAGESGEPAYHDPSENSRQEPIVTGPKIGRNDPCPCGSGKKYKSCHG